MPQRTLHQHRNHIQRRKLNYAHHGANRRSGIAPTVLFESVRAALENGKEIFRNGQQMFAKYIYRRGMGRGG